MNNVNGRILMLTDIEIARRTKLEPIKNIADAGI